MMTEERNIEEKIIHPVNGTVMLIVNLILLVAFCVLFAVGVQQTEGGSFIASVVMIVVSCVGVAAVLIAFGGLKTVRPNEALVLTLFGAYYGSIR